MHFRWVFWLIVAISIKASSDSFLDESPDPDIFSHEPPSADALTEPTSPPLLAQVGDEMLSDLPVETSDEPENLFDPVAPNIPDGGDNMPSSNLVAESHPGQSDLPGLPGLEYILGTPTSDEVPHPQNDQCRGREGKTPLCCSGSQNGLLRSACDPGRFLSSYSAVNLILNGFTPFLSSCNTTWRGPLTVSSARFRKSAIGNA